MNLKKLNKSTLLIFAWLMLSVLNASAQTDSADGNVINKKPLVDFTNSLVTKWEKNEIDLTKSFSIQFVGTLDEDGILETSSSTFTEFKGDKDIVNVVQNAVIAVGKSGLFQYLSTVGITEIDAIISQDEGKVSASLTSNMKSERKAKTTARNLSGLLSVAKLVVKTEDEKKILNSFSTVKNDGANTMVQFEMAKPVFQTILKQQFEIASENRQKKSQM